IVSTALRDKRIGTVVPTNKTFRIKTIRVLPYPCIMIGTVNIQHHPRPNRKRAVPTGKCLPDNTADKRKERIKAAHFLHKSFEIARITIFYLLPCFRVFMQRNRCEQNKTGNGNSWPDEVEHFNRSNL